MLRKFRFSLASLVLISLTAAQAAQAVTAREREIIERIKPVGSVCIQGRDCSAGAESAQASEASTTTGAATPAAADTAAPVAAARSGETIYSTACVACHSTGVGGAPKMGAAADWAPRIAQGEAMMLEHSMKGLRAMPPMGTCMNCSEDEMKLAIEHMLANSK